MPPGAFKGRDLIILILLNNPRRLSYVLIQVKNDKSLSETDKKNEKSLTTLSPHEKLDDPKCPFIGIWMSLRGKPPSSKFPSKSAVKVMTEDLPKKLVVVASGVRGAVYPALREGTMADKMIAEKLHTLLGCTDHINVVGESQYLQGLYPIDDESLKQFILVTRDVFVSYSFSAPCLLRCCFLFLYNSLSLIQPRFPSHSFSVFLIESLGFHILA